MIILVVDLAHYCIKRPKGGVRANEIAKLDCSPLPLGVFPPRKIFLGQTIFLCLVCSNAQLIGSKQNKLMGSRQNKSSCPKKISLETRQCDHICKFFY